MTVVTLLLKGIIMVSTKKEFARLAKFYSLMFIVGFMIGAIWELLNVFQTPSKSK